MSEIYIMGEDFQPSRTGRKRLVSIDDLIEEMYNNPGSWLAQNFATRGESRSAVRQLKLLPEQDKVQISTRTENDGSRTVFCRIKSD